MQNHNKHVEKYSLEPQPQRGEIRDIPDDQQRGWVLEVNGKQVEDVKHARLTHPKLGVDVDYGLRPEGYDGFYIKEPGGGGAVTIPYFIGPDNGQIYVGLVKETRATLGGDVYNIPRGFLDAGESHEDAAKRELHEETGLRAIGQRVLELARGLNPNSTFFNTSESADAGVGIFAVEVRGEELDIEHNENGEVYYEFKKPIRDAAEGDKGTEKIIESRFVPLQEALTSRDMFTSAAAGQLVGRLLKSGYVVKQESDHAATGADLKSTM